MYYETGLFCAEVEIEAEKLESVLDRLAKAKEEIRACYYELKELGIVRIKESPAGADGTGKGIIAVKGSDKG